MKSFNYREKSAVNLNNYKNFSKTGCRQKSQNCKAVKPQPQNFLEQVAPLHERDKLVAAMSHSR